MRSVITGLLLRAAYAVCPNGSFKVKFAEFILNNITRL